MNSPAVPISWGELFDKITILQIKLNTLISKSALDNVSREHDLLQAIFTKYFIKNKQASQLLLHLQQINQQLWDIEDRIRDKERDKVFDDEFVQLARSVYITNDERSRVKRKINDVFGSDLIEEKSYADYSL